MKQQPQLSVAAPQPCIREQVLINKISRWLEEHGEALVAAPMARLVVHISGTSIRVHIEHIYEST